MMSKVTAVPKSTTTTGKGIPSATTAAALASRSAPTVSGLGKSTANPSLARCETSTSGLPAAARVSRSRAAFSGTTEAITARSKAWPASASANEAAVAGRVSTADTLSATTPPSAVARANLVRELLLLMRSVVAVMRTRAG